MKILILGRAIEDNFGVISLLKGAIALINSIHNNAEIIYAEKNDLSEKLKKDIGIRTIDYKNCEVKNLIIDAILYRLKIKRKHSKKFLDELYTSDIVADIYGIYFCNRFKKHKRSYLKTKLMIYGQFGLCFIGKLFNKKVVKCPASYGPITQYYDILAAKTTVNRIFDVTYAREKESKASLEKLNLKKEIRVSPDLANLMPYEENIIKHNDTIGISVSSQIIRNWNSKEPYIDCIVELINHVNSKYNYKVILIANEIHKTNPYNDFHLAKDILLKVNNDMVTLPDPNNMSSLEIKNLISSSKIIVSSRYHSCVAALSSNVPVLVIGWHYKYEELLSIYNQDKWLIKDNNCNKKILINKFDDLNSNYINERNIIKEQFKIVKKSLLECGKIMF